MRYEISNYDYLLARLAEVASDDLTLPWQTYPCLEWDRWRAPFGYGLIDRRPGILYVHRFACESINGPLSSGVCALHRCDNPPCFRPIHLFAGTRADNNRDMKSKGRGKTLKGTESRKSKLLDGDVIEILRLADSGWSQRAIASKFGVSHTNVGFILTGKNWGHVVSSPRTRGPANPKGGAHPRARITDAEAMDIIRRYKSGERPRYLAEEFKTTRSAVYGLVYRSSFRHLDI